MSQMRAKYQVTSVSTIRYPGDNPDDNLAETIALSAVIGGTPEDNTFHKYTPYGKMEITITNPALQNTIHPGQKYYIDFTLTE